MLALAIEGVLSQQLKPPARPTAAQVLGFILLYRVRDRLLGRARQERCHPVGPPPKKPWRLTLRYDELVALVGILPEAPSAGLAWDEVQRVSLNLAQGISSEAPVG